MKCCKPGKNRGKNDEITHHCAHRVRINFRYCEDSAESVALGVNDLVSIYSDLTHYAK